MALAVTKWEIGVRAIEIEMCFDWYLHNTANGNIAYTFRIRQQSSLVWFLSGATEAITLL